MLPRQHLGLKAPSHARPRQRALVPLSIAALDGYDVRSLGAVLLPISRQQHQHHERQPAVARSALGNGAGCVIA